MNKYPVRTGILDLTSFAMEPLMKSDAKGNTVNWKKMFIKMMFKVCVSAIVKVIITKIIVEAIRR